MQIIYQLKNCGSSSEAFATFWAAFFIFKITRPISSNFQPPPLHQRPLCLSNVFPAGSGHNNCKRAHSLESKWKQACECTGTETRKNYKRKASLQIGSLLACHQPCFEQGSAKPLWVGASAMKSRPTTESFSARGINTRRIIDWLWFSSFTVLLGRFCRSSCQSFGSPQ